MRPGRITLQRRAITLTSLLPVLLPPPRPRRLLLPGSVSLTSDQRLALECLLPITRLLQRGRVIFSDRFLSNSLL